jgi:aspartyl-tRNA(Asn)/glutamyl-tRNA(Gln) amidotransferase subunit A
MSLLREAEKCITNQRSHAALNAFITTVQNSGPWREQVRDAELRRESGKIPAAFVPFSLWLIRALTHAF